MDPPRCKGSRTLSDPRIAAIPDIHGHAKGEHRPFAEERPIAYSARMLFLWFFHACRRNSPRFLMVSDHINYLTFEDPGAVNTVRRALKLAHAGDLYGAAETAGVDVAHAAVVGEGLRRGMRYSIGAEVDNDPRARPDAQNIVDAMRPDAIIRSVKFLTIDHPEKGGEYAWPFDNAEFAQYYDTVGVERVWELYVARLLDDIEKLPGHIVGDFYRPGRHGHWPDDAKLQQYEDQMLDAALSRGMAIEVYARPFYRDIPQEQRERLIALNKRLMRKAKEKNVPIAIGSGAHSPKDQGGGFDTVLHMLDECEINEIVFPVGGRLARVALRATKEHIEKHQKTQEPAQPGSSISGLSRAELGLPEEAERGEEVSTSKTGRDAGPKKRASSPTRTTKKPEPEDAPAKSSSRRSAESAASSAKAKEDAATSAAEPPLLDEEHSSAESVEPVAVEPPAAVEAPSPARAAKKSRAKTAAANVAAGKTQPVAEPVAAEKLPAKAPAVKKESAKAVNAAKAPAKKAAAKSAAAKPAVKKAPAKIASKSVKAAAKKAPAKKAAAVKKAAPAAKKAAPKKTAAKLAPKPKKTATKSAAKKPAAKKTATATRLVKKASKPASKGTTTKKKSTKRR